MDKNEPKEDTMKAMMALLFASVVSIACVPGWDQPGYQIDPSATVEDQSGLICVSYNDCVKLFKDDSTKLAATFAPQNEYKKLLRNLAVGGMVRVLIKRKSIEEASPAAFTFVVRKDTSTYYRGRGEDIIPQNIDSLWCSVVFVSIKDLFAEPPYKFYIIDSYAQKRYEFTIKASNKQ